jgi:transposase
MRAYSLDLREKIVKAYEVGNTSIRKVAELFQVSKNTVQALLKKQRSQESLEPLAATGGKPSQMRGSEAEIEAMVSEHPDYTLNEYCEYWGEKTGTWVSESTMCRWLQRQKLTLKKNTEEQSSSNGDHTIKTGRILGGNQRYSPREFSVFG